jgi:hypothetical protein
MVVAQYSGSDYVSNKINIMYKVFDIMYMHREYYRQSKMHQAFRFALVGVLLMNVGGATVAAGAAGPVTATTEDKGEWREIETGTFVIEYKDGYKDDAAYVGDVSENAYAELQEAFPEHVSEPSFGEPIHIRVYPGDEWSRSDYALSWRDTTPVRIHVKAPSDSEAGDDWYEHGLAHELGNMFLWDEAGRYDNYNYFERNPSWFPEGLTEYYVYNTPTVEDQFPPGGVADWNETIAAGDGEFAALEGDQYDGGHVLSMYLVDEYGEDAVWDLLRNDADNWDEAVMAELNVTQTEQERNWYQWAEEHIGGDYSDRIDRLGPAAALDSAEAEIDELEGELDEKETEIEQLEAENDELKAENEELNEELDPEADNTVVVFGAGFGIGVVFVSIFVALYFMKDRLGDDEAMD